MVVVLEVGVKGQDLPLEHLAHQEELQSQLLLHALLQSQYILLEHGIDLSVVVLGAQTFDDSGVLATEVD